MKNELDKLAEAQAEYNAKKYENNRCPFKTEAAREKYKAQQRKIVRASLERNLRKKTVDRFISEVEGTGKNDKTTKGAKNE